MIWHSCMAALFMTFLRAEMTLLQADAQKPIKHFHPRFPSNSDPSLAQASALFAAFVFRKTGR